MPQTRRACAHAWDVLRQRGLWRSPRLRPHHLRKASGLHCVLAGRPMASYGLPKQRVGFVLMMIAPQKLRAKYLRDWRSVPQTQCKCGQLLWPSSDHQGFNKQLHGPQAGSQQGSVAFVLSGCAPIPSGVAISEPLHLSALSTLRRWFLRCPKLGAHRQGCRRSLLRLSL